MKQKIPIENIRNNRTARNDFISEYTNFILSSASKAVGHYVSKEDDVFSVAMIAFDEAITKYDDSKGNFFSFAEIMIRNRIIDEHRKVKSNVVPFSSLVSDENSDGERKEFDVAGSSDIVSDTALEFKMLKEELVKYGFSIFDISKDSPKSSKTKKSVYAVLCFIKNNKDAVRSVTENKEIPSKLICDNVSVSRKLLERHRKYIIASTVILCGDYPIIAQYIKNLEGVAK